MRNVEIKAKIENFEEFVCKASKVSDKPEVVMGQIDTYFNVPNGRLKLRQIKSGENQLIFYDRPDTKGPKLSKYSKQDFQNVDEAEGLKVMLNGDETVEHGQQVADELMSRLGVLQADLISGSYIDMLLNKKLCLQK